MRPAVMVMAAGLGRGYLVSDFDFAGDAKKALPNLSSNGHRLLEPFAGGASVGLAFASAGAQVDLVEADKEVAAFWAVACSPRRDELAARILACDPLQVLADGEPTEPVALALFTLVRNRLAFGGCMAPRAGKIRAGDGAGQLSRWHPETLAGRVLGLESLAVEVQWGDGIASMEAIAGQQGPVGFAFVDPPYLGAGDRLYRHHQMDHGRMLDACLGLGCPWLLTYGADPASKALLERRGVPFVDFHMLGNTGKRRPEVLAGPWWVICKLMCEAHSFPPDPLL